MYKIELLSKVQLYVIADKKLCGERDIEKVVVQAIEGGAQMIQYRDKESDDDTFFEIASRLRDTCKRNNVPFMVNDRVMIALKTDADGVHVGEEDLPISEARSILGSGKIIGRSTRSVDQAKAAQEEGADYVGLGPVFHTDSKLIKEPIGLEAIRGASKALKIPCFAIGGINLDNLDLLIDAGGRRIAVISAVISSEDVRASAAKLLEKLRAQNPP